MKPNRLPPGRSPRTLLALAAAALSLTGACGGNDTAGDAETKSSDTVTMRLIAFTPDVIDVKRGATVTWKQTDAGAHTVTSGTVEQDGGGVVEKRDDTFDSGDIATGETFEFTFPEPGTYPYFCALHPATMRGEVRVS